MIEIIKYAQVKEHDDRTYSYGSFSEAMTRQQFEQQISAYDLFFDMRDLPEGVAAPEYSFFDSDGTTLTPAVLVARDGSYYGYIAIKTIASGNFVERSDGSFYSDTVLGVNMLIKPAAEGFEWEVWFSHAAARCGTADTIERAMELCSEVLAEEDNLIASVRAS